MQICKTGIGSVDALYGVDFTGNIIPHAWYSAIQTDAGKPDMVAIVILSEVLYWHRPREECDESDAKTIKLSKRFNADLLQMSYSQLTMKFGFSRDQSRRAIEHLEALGLVKRHFRTVTSATGGKLGNVMFLELFAERLIELTYPDGYSAPYRKKPTRVSEKTDEVIGKNQQGSMKKPMTNTKNTTEITTKDYDSIYHPAVRTVKDQVGYDRLTEECRYDTGVIDEMVDLMAEIMISDRDVYTVNGQSIPAAAIKEKFSAAGSEVLKSALEGLKSSPGPIRNMRGYMLTTLYNAASTHETELDNRVRCDMYVNNENARGIIPRAM